MLIHQTLLIRHQKCLCALKQRLLSFLWVQTPLLWQVSSFAASINPYLILDFHQRFKYTIYPLKTSHGGTIVGIRSNVILCCFSYKRWTLFGSWTTDVVTCPSCGGYFHFQGTLAQQTHILSLKPKKHTVLPAPWIFWFHCNHRILSGSWGLREGTINTSKNNEERAPWRRNFGKQNWFGTSGQN